MGWVVHSLVHKIMYTVLYLCLFFRFPNYFYTRIKHNMVTTTITNDWLGERLNTLYKDSTKSGRDKCMGNLLPAPEPFKKGAGSLLRSIGVLLYPPSNQMRDICRICLTTRDNSRQWNWPIGVLLYQLVNRWHHHHLRQTETLRKRAIFCLCSGLTFLVLYSLFQG